MLEEFVPELLLKFQSHPVIVPDETVDKSVKHVGLNSQDTVEENEATGSGENEIGNIRFDWQPAFEVAVSVTFVFVLTKL